MHSEFITASVTETQDSPVRYPAAGSWLSLSLIVIACLLTGYLATEMNRFFYASNQPFYDSMAYHRHTHQVMTTSAKSGLPATANMIWEGQTVCLPFLIAAVAGLFVEPSREIGIWIQVGELIVFCGSLWYYLNHVKRLSPITSTFAILPFLLLQCLYKFNGGISDYRMDLSLMLLFGASCIWYLTAMRSGDYRHYAAFGLCLGAACLFRATAPIYLTLTLVPLAIFDSLFVRRDKRHWLGLVFATVIATALSLWFYILNFDYLYYYYLVWNTDANAKLPFSESQKHFSFVADHIGRAAIYYLVLFQLIVIWARLKEVGYSVNAWRQNLSLDIKSVDWRLLWIGMIPALFLVVRGAGLNPFVCMPACIGVYLFCLLPHSDGRRLNFSPAMLIWLAIGLGVCWMSATRAGWKNHRGDSPLSMTAHQSTLDAILTDCMANGKTHAKYATTHSFFLNTYSLEATAVFDRPATKLEGNSVRMETVDLEAVGVFAINAEAEWNNLEGQNENDKLDRLVKTSETKVDYLIIPSVESAALLEKNVTHNVINRYASVLRERLLSSGNWGPIWKEIHNRDDEVVQVYRNLHKNGRSLSANSEAPGRVAKK